MDGKQYMPSIYAFKRQTPLAQNFVPQVQVCASRVQAPRRPLCLISNLRLCQLNFVPHWQLGQLHIVPQEYKMRHKV